MRTTVTFDEDVADLLKKEKQTSGEPFKQMINRIVRLGLTASRQPARKPFKVKPRNLGLPDFEKTEQYIEFLEGPNHGSRSVYPL